MTFQLLPSETLAAGIRRLLLEQLAYAEAQLEDSSENVDVRVHEARKAFKRSRAVLRLVRAELPATGYAELNHALRDAGRQLADRRVHFVLRGLAKDLSKESTDPSAVEGFTALRDGLADTDRPLALTPELSALLEDVRGRVADWPAGWDDFERIRPGLLRVYRTGRRRMKVARRDPSCAHFHEWRKVVKYLWHQIEVLQPTQPSVLTPCAEMAHSLASRLGDEHDLCELLAAARSSRAGIRPEAWASMERRLEERRGVLRETIWAAAKEVYREKPRRFANRLARYWEDWRMEALQSSARRYANRSAARTRRDRTTT